MIDSAYIRENSDTVVDNLANRGYEFDINAFIKLDEEKRGLQKSLEELQAQRNKLSKEYGELKKAGASTKDLDLEIGNLKTLLVDEEVKFKDAQIKLDELVSEVPNLISDSTPIGKNENSNKFIRKSSDPEIQQSPDHLEITTKISTEIAAKLAGSRFAVLENDLAKLQRALIHFMLTEATKMVTKRCMSLSLLIKNHYSEQANCLNLRMIYLKFLTTIILFQQQRFHLPTCTEMRLLTYPRDL